MALTPDLTESERIRTPVRQRRQNAVVDGCNGDQHNAEKGQTRQNIFTVFHIL